MCSLIFKLIFLICYSFLTTACANIFSAKPAGLTINIQAVSYLNPNIYRRSSPVVIVIYQLKSAAAFKTANFFSLYNDPAKILGNDLLDKREFEIRPQQNISLQQELVPNAHYVGILAAFRNPDKAQWKKIIQLPAFSNRTNINIHLAAQSIAAALRE